MEGEKEDYRWCKKYFSHLKKDVLHLRKKIVAKEKNEIDEVYWDGYASAISNDRATAEKDERKKLRVRV